MKSARTVLSGEPAGGVTAGIDWARDDHAISVVDARGREVSQHTITHSAAGLRELISVLARQAPRKRRSSVPTARSSTLCSAQGSLWW